MTSTGTSNPHRKALLVLSSLTALVMLGACSSSVGGAPAANGVGAGVPGVMTVAGTSTPGSLPASQVPPPGVSVVPVPPTTIPGGSSGGTGGSSGGSSGGTGVSSGGAQPPVPVSPIPAPPTIISDGGSGSNGSSGSTTGGNGGGVTGGAQPPVRVPPPATTPARPATPWPADLCQVLRPSDLPSNGKLDADSPTNQKGYQCSYSYNNSAQNFTLVDEEGPMSFTDPAGGATEIVRKTIAGREGIQFRLHGSDRTECAVEFKAGGDAAFVNYLGTSGDACPAVLKIAETIASRLPKPTY